MDSKYRREIEKKIFILIIIFLLGVVVCFHYQDTKTMSNIISHVIDGKPIKFNLDTGFYDKEVYIQLRLDEAFPQGAKIYYTVNGENPDKDSTEYKEKIKLQIEEKAKVYCVKAVAYYKDEYSNIEEKSYVLGKNIYKEFDLPVLNLVIDPQELYDEDRGLFAEKNLYNRSDDFAKISKITLFDTEGNVMINQNVRIRLFGGSTARDPIKSFKIKTLENDDIILSFKDEMSNNSIVEKYKNLKLRSGGQDGYKTNIRESVFSRLGEESNFDGCAKSMRCIVFLNGEFYGIYDLEQNYSHSFLGNKFKIKDNDNIEIYGASDLDVLRKSNTIEYITRDLNSLENIQKLEQHIDMDNYLLYFAIQILGNNSDFAFNNNVKAWRYSGENIDDENEYTDGRLRYLMYDLDMTYYRKENLEWENWNDIGKDVFERLIQEESSFYYVMNSNYYRNKFITIICDLINTSFKEDNILKIIDEEYYKISSSNEKYFSMNECNEKIKNVNTMKENAVYWRNNVISDIEELYNLKDKYKFKLVNKEGTAITWNNMSIYANEQYENEYYKNIEFKIEAKEYPGYNFEYWIVNGKKIYENTLSINDNIIENNKVEIETVVSKNADEAIIISEISTKGDSDWIKLTNISDKNININKYFISDDEQNYMKYQLPNISLKSNESVIINGKKNYYSLGDYICNFNLNDDETLYLYNKEKDLISDKVKVPSMSKNETYGRYNNSCVFKYFNNINNIRKNIK